MTFLDFVAIFLIFVSIYKMHEYRQSYINLTNDLEYKKISKFRIIEFSSNGCMIICCAAMIYLEHFDEYSKIVVAMAGILFLSSGLIVAYRNFKFLNKKDFPEYNAVYLDSYKRYVTGKIKWILIITIVMSIFLFIRDNLNELL